MDSSRVNALIASAYNVYGPRSGEAMTPAKAAKLSRSERAELCRLMEIRGGSDLFTVEDAKAAFAEVVG